MSRQALEPQTPYTALVTGCAGFIGSHLAAQLLADGHQVIGVDCFTPFYPRAVKERNLGQLTGLPGFSFRELDLGVRRVIGLLEGIDIVYHLAGQPGVRPSFGGGFKTYVRNNIQVTQRLLEQASRNPVQAFVYASSSSVYGNAERYPSGEDDPLAPISPYAMSKHATEEIAKVYHRTRNVPVIGLRYFTVYGPRQRPDMAFTRFFDAALAERPLPVLGDGLQLREFTYVDDVVRGTLAAAEHGVPGHAYNIGGGSAVSLEEVIGRMEHVVGRPLERTYSRAPRGDVRETRADGTLALRDLGYRALISLDDGLRAQYAAHASLTPLPVPIP
ncbi:NAD-dependent epimerase/dehydratase family protein [Paraconexibacter antarcticus]|uniref:NAD-dependent epimerase/dehydratase family protein n=1 Tax=Paraconexibacter antarcticus TaxID=2949664 RepID=A0ABY5DKM9_9ACTN|nr:NAD-dependent epimerase/dehydratase family protein [Paraconexibacter antarcticus]UTI62270.1 NAD-dependent epimerase/dehydratase family protein [Paraconexibacter antarcticus]